MYPLISEPKVLIVFVVLFLAGCATTGIDTDRLPPSDFPTLTIVSHYMSNEEMLEQCKKYLPVGKKWVACAVVNFDRRVCDIRYGSASPPQWLQEHEEFHCKGYDHPGESTIRDSWENYKHHRNIR